MSDDRLRLLIGSLSNTIFENRPDASEILSSLIKDTVNFRDKLKEETGQILSVGDTRIALDALETHLNGEPFPKDLTPEQKALAQILIDRVILFKVQ